MTDATSRKPGGDGLTRVSFALGPWPSPADPGWQQSYDDLLAELSASGRPIYGVLEPDLAPTPLGELLQAGGTGEAEEAAGWLAAYVAHAAAVVARYADRVAAFEVLPQPETGPNGTPMVSADWMARALGEIRTQAGQGHLLACLPAGPQGGAVYLEALYAAGQAHWGRDAAAALDGLSLRLLLDLAAAPAADSAAQALAELSAALERLEGAAAAGKGLYVSGFILAGTLEPLAVDMALAAAIKAIDSDPRAYLAAELSAGMGPGAMPEEDAPSRDGDEGPPSTWALFTPAPLGPQRSGPLPEPPVVDGFDYPCWKDVNDPWRDYKIDAYLCDPGYFKLFKGVWHPGEDWNGKGGGNTDLGDPIYAIAHGVVVTAKYFPGSWGNIVLVRHSLPDGSSVWSQYAHLDAMHVVEGDVLLRGQQLGTLGKGDPKAKMLAHLHFEVRLTELRADNWGPLVRDKDQVLANYAVPKDFIAARRPGQMALADAVTVIVDETEAGFRKADVPHWMAAGVGYGGNAWYTFAARTNEANVATWTATLPEAGNYQVAVFVPRAHASTQNAVYTVTHSGGQTKARVDQARFHDQWVPLGAFPFAAGGQVGLSDVTGEAEALRRKVAFDAVRWMKVG